VEWMARRIRIAASGIQVVAELNDTHTAGAIWEALPITGRVNLWGEEIYFRIPVDLELEDGQEVVTIGDLGYWPQGSALCIFFGATPASRGDEIRPASAVTVFGKVIGDTTSLRSVPSGAEIRIDNESGD
jgi:hypothetical protein